MHSTHMLNGARALSTADYERDPPVVVMSRKYWLYLVRLIMRLRRMCGDLLFRFVFDSNFIAFELLNSVVRPKFNEINSK